MGLFSGIGKAISGVAKGIGGAVKKVAEFAKPLTPALALIPGVGPGLALAAGAATSALAGDGLDEITGIPQLGASKNYTPQQQGFAPQQQGFAPQQQSYAPQQQGYASQPAPKFGSSYYPYAESVSKYNRERYDNELKAAEFADNEYNRAQDTVQGLFSKFNPEYYNNIRQGVLDSGNTKADRDYTDNQKALEVALSRKGLTRSSVAADKASDLYENYGKQRIGAADLAEKAVKDRELQVSQARSQAMRYAQTGQSLAAPILSSAMNSGVQYTPPPNGAFGDLASAMSDSNALSRFKQSKQNDLLKQVQGIPTNAAASLQLDKLLSPTGPLSLPNFQEMLGKLTSGISGYDSAKSFYTPGSAAGGKYTGGSFAPSLSEFLSPSSSFTPPKVGSGYTAGTYGAYNPLASSSTPDFGFNVSPSNQFSSASTLASNPGILSRIGSSIKGGVSSIGNFLSGLF